ncbi:helix-turn-helix domain-containing protein [Neobacillus mesonae]|uniref:helix-turn-helix domain-containing protein n=1 Tax=Neobacillus mesonae TaxID=1193713 RepID=UPI00203D58A4|nr:helix-turn-helix domain-containing protein [Neobacillus mesonae]MCM3568458.1 DNA-binding response regulator [Neobacillus mesonae]
MADILIVDNNGAERKEICSIIKDSPYNFLNVYEAGSAQRGLMLLKQNQPSVLILDISLPDMDGIKFGRTALELYPSLPVIIVSHLKMFELVQMAINAGFDSYLLKPLAKHDLLQTFDRLLPPGLGMNVSTIPNSMTQIQANDLKNPINSAIQYIQANYGNPLTLKEISDQVYLSASYFSKLFKEETGMTFIEYLTFVRVQKAKGLLRLSSLPIEIIANSSGFSNQSYFSTAFKKIVGKTPKEYRDQFLWNTKKMKKVRAIEA